MWTEMSRRGFGFKELVRWLIAGPARQVGLEKRKGALSPGLDADLVIWNPSGELRVEPGMIEHRHKLTPYNGRLLKGVVQATFLRGVKIYEGGRFHSGPKGLKLLRGSLF
jgi:allantoinase